MPVEFGWKYEVLVEAITPLATVRNWRLNMISAFEPRSYLSFCTPLAGKRADVKEFSRRTKIPPNGIRACDGGL